MPGSLEQLLRRDTYMGAQDPVKDRVIIEKQARKCTDGDYLRPVVVGGSIPCRSRRR